VWLLQDVGERLRNLVTGERDLYPAVSDLYLSMLGL
jgi:hypothetical protein